jgi:hypothetical protein
LHVGLCGRSSVQKAVGVNVGEVLALFFGERRYHLD